MGSNPAVDANEMYWSYEEMSEQERKDIIDDVRITAHMKLGYMVPQLWSSMKNVIRHQEPVERFTTEIRAPKQGERYWSPVLENWVEALSDFSSSHLYPVQVQS